MNIVSLDSYINLDGGTISFFDQQNTPLTVQQSSDFINQAKNQEILLLINGVACFLSEGNFKYNYLWISNTIGIGSNIESIQLTRLEYFNDHFSVDRIELAGTLTLTRKALTIVEYTQ